jgi:hypothetical protein
MSMPRLLRLIEDRDLWRFQDPDSKPLHYALDYDGDFRLWSPAVLEPEVLDAWIHQGADRLQYLRRQWASVAANASPLMRWHGDAIYPALHPPTAVLCNSPPQWFSDVGHLLLHREDAPEIAVLYADSERSGQRTYSLRSRNDGPNVAAIAEFYHGGGHPHAAGFKRPLGEIGLELVLADLPAAAARIVKSPSDLVMPVEWARCDA